MDVTEVGRLLEDVFCAVVDLEYLASLINYEGNTDFVLWLTKMDTSKIP